MNDECKWEWYSGSGAGIASIYALRSQVPAKTWGFLAKGSKKRQGWFVHRYRMTDPITRLPHTMPIEEAQAAAKLILLTLKESP